MKLSYLLFETDFGWMGIWGSPAGLRGVTLPHPSPEAVLQAMGGGFEGAPAGASFFGDLPHRLREVHVEHDYPHDHRGMDLNTRCKHTYHEDASTHTRHIDRVMAGGSESMGTTQIIRCVITTHILENRADILMK